MRESVSKIAVILRLPSRCARLSDRQEPANSRSAPHCPGSEGVPPAASGVPPENLLNRRSHTSILQRGSLADLQALRGIVSWTRTGASAGPLRRRRFIFQPRRWPVAGLPWVTIKKRLWSAGSRRRRGCLRDRSKPNLQRSVLASRLQSRLLSSPYNLLCNYVANKPRF